MKVIVVTKNADFTEGRGPMVFQGVFSSYETADAFVNSHKAGIFGAKPLDGMSLAESCRAVSVKYRNDGTSYTVRLDGGWGGFEFQEVEVDGKLR